MAATRAASPSGVVQAFAHGLELAALDGAHQGAEAGHRVLPGDVLEDRAALYVAHAGGLLVDVLQDVQHVAHVAVGILGLDAQLGYRLGRAQAGQNRAHRGAGHAALDAGVAEQSRGGGDRLQALAVLAADAGGVLQRVAEHADVDVVPGECRSQYVGHLVHLLGWNTHRRLDVRGDVSSVAEVHVARGGQVEHAGHGAEDLLRVVAGAAQEVLALGDFLVGELAGQRQGAGLLP